MSLVKHDVLDIISIPVILISLVTFIFPFVNLLYVFLPVNFFGKNIWLSVTVLTIFALFFLTFFNEKRNVVFKKNDLIFFFTSIVFVCVLLMRSLAYFEPASLLDKRFIFVPFIFFLVLIRFVKGQRNVNLLRWVLIATCFIQALLGILHAHFFSEINLVISPDDSKGIELVFDAQRTREGGTLGESIYANVVVCGMFLLASLNDKRMSFRANFLLISSILIMLYAVLLSGSRYPIGVGALLSAYLLLKFLTSFRQILVALTLLVVAIVFMDKFEFLGILRFDQDSGGRIDKLLLPLELLSGSIMSFFIGAPSSVIANTVSAEGVAISDNSYMLVAVEFGFFFSVGFFVFLIELFRRNISDRFSLFYLIYVFIGLGITNCILWEPWVFIAMLTSCILYYGKPLSQAHIARAV